MPAPIDLQIAGRDTVNNYKIARRLETGSRVSPARPTFISTRCSTNPSSNINVDRIKAGQLGLDPARRHQQHADFAQRKQSGGPNFWLNPANGVSYNVGVQTSQYRIDSLDQMLRTPITRQPAR